jgi:hypothetical protein
MPSVPVSTSPNGVPIVLMSEDVEALPPAERARVKARDRKVRGPKVVVDNVSLKQAALQRAQREREKRKPRP